MTKGKKGDVEDGRTEWPSFTREEADAVTDVLLSNKVNYWTGEEGRKFEKEFARLVGCEYAVALANGTVALDLALKVLDIGPGDEVVVTPRTFIASVSCIVNSGATPVFVDVDASSQNISVDTIRPALGSRTKAILCVHLAGWPCEMDPIRELADEHGLLVIEDCAQAHGAYYHGRPVGSLGHVAAWSFCQDKIMTTGGEGGMLTTNDAGIWKRAWSYKDHGKSWDQVYATTHPPGFRWLHESFGTNWRLTEIQSAIGRIQVKKMPQWHAARVSNAQAILDTCEKFSETLRVPVPPRHVEHAWYKCYVFVRPQGLAAGWTRDRIIAEFDSLGVSCFTGSCSEVYLEKAFDMTGFRPKSRLPVAARLGETGLMFPVHPTLTAEDIKRTCRAIEQVMGMASIQRGND